MAIEQLIYTDRPYGKGVDPRRSGYQLAASSAGLGTTVLQHLESICAHYGDAVYRCAPESAIAQEQTWQAQTLQFDAVPLEVLRLFPVAWSYDRIQNSEYALTRI